MKAPRRISPRARDYVRKQATAVMEATVRIERVEDPGFDEDTLIAAAGGRLTLYEGICRLWESTGRQQVAIGDSELIVQTTNLSIPWDAIPQAPLDPTNLENMPRRNDQFVMLSHPTDSTVVGVRGNLLDVAKAGELRATRRYAVQLLQSKGDHES